MKWNSISIPSQGQTSGNKRPHLRYPGPRELCPVGERVHTWTCLYPFGTQHEPHVPLTALLGDVDEVAAKLAVCRATVTRS
jgi:hypothetical protein